MNSFMLSIGRIGFQVSTLQWCLNYLVNPSPPLKIDGAFGPQTKKAVIAFQNQNLLKADGFVGPQTWKAILDNFEPENQSLFTTSKIQHNSPTRFIIFDRPI